MTSRHMKLAALLGSAALAIWALATLQGVLLPVLLALLLAYLLDPAVTLLMRLRLTRPQAIALIYVLGIALVVLALLFAIPWATQEGKALAQRVTEIPELGVSLVSRIENRLGMELGLKREAGELSQRVKRWLLSNRERLLSREALGTTWSGLKGAGNALLTIVLVPVYGYFFLLSLHRLPGTLRDLLPVSYRDKGMSILTQVHQTMAAFFRGRLLICLGKGIVAALGMGLGQVPFGVLVGFLSGTLSLVPFLAFPVGALLGCSFALLDGQGMAGILWVVGSLLAAEAFESAAGPWILGREMALHPAVVLFALLVGAKCMGAMGLLLAVPLAAVVKILWREMLSPWWREMADREGA